jgi:tetratricopeptide (TPR) repeat protein
MPAVDFMECVARALVDVFAEEVGELSEVLPEVAERVWQEWGQGREADDLLTDMGTLARYSGEALRHRVERVTYATANDKSEVLQHLLKLFLAHLPHMMWHSRRLEIPTNTLPFLSIPRDAEGVLRLLPSRLSCYQAGDRPFSDRSLYLETLLGLGTYGETWLVRDERGPERPPRAVKFITDPAVGDCLRGQTLALERVMQRARHPGIVRLLGIELLGGLPSFHSEDFRCGTLTVELVATQDASARWSPYHSARVILALTEIVRFAHRLEPPLIHGDLKPSNILVSPDGERTVYTITDYGIGGMTARHTLATTARGSARGRFLTSAVQGAYSPLYASPQLLRGEPPDPRDDIFALGVIWCQLLTGDLTRGRPGGTRWHHRLLARGVPSRLLSLLAECLEEDRSDRIPDAATLAELLTEALPLKQACHDREPEVERRIRDHVDRARRAILAGDHERARSEAASILMLDHVVTADLIFSESYRLSGNFQEAIDYATEALELQPHESQTYLTRARAYFAKGDIDCALADTYEVARLNPREFDAWCLQAECLWRKKEWQRGIFSADQALQLDPKHPQPYTIRAECHRLLGDYRKAVADATEALKYQPMNRQAFVTRGEAHRMLNELERAIADATEAIRLDASDPAPYTTRGEAHRLRGVLVRAIADFNDSLRLNPTDAWCLASRGVAKGSTGDYSAALTDLNEALRLSRNHPAAHAFRGHIYRRMGKFDIAVTDLEESLRLSPQYAWAAKELERAKRGETSC